MATTTVIGNPIVVTGTASSEETITDMVLHVNTIRWFQPTTNAHLLTLTDKEGNTVAKFYASANVSENIEVNGRINGIHVTDMDSGELHIYTK